LVSRPDACDEVIKAASKSGNYKVLAAYLARPGIASAVLESLVRKERRVKVLVAVASAENTPLAVLRSLASDERHGVSLAIVQNLRLSPADRAPAAQRLLSKYGGLSYGDRTALEG